MQHVCMYVAGCRQQYLSIIRQHTRKANEVRPSAWLYPLTMMGSRLRKYTDNTHKYIVTHILIHA